MMMHRSHLQDEDAEAATAVEVRWTIKAPSGDHANSVAAAIRERNGCGSGCEDGHFRKDRCDNDHIFEECHREACLTNGDPDNLPEWDRCTAPGPPPLPNLVSTAPICATQPSSSGKGRRLEQADEEIEELRAKLAAAEALLAKKDEQLQQQAEQLQHCA